MRGRRIAESKPGLLVEALEQRIAPASVTLHSAIPSATDPAGLAHSGDAVIAQGAAIFFSLPASTPESPGVAVALSIPAQGTVIAFRDSPFVDNATPTPFASGILRSFVVDRDPGAGVALDFYYQIVNTSPAPDPFGDSDFYRLNTVGGFDAALRPGLEPVFVAQVSSLSGLTAGTSGIDFSSYTQGAGLQKAATADRAVGGAGNVGFDFPTQPPLPFTGNVNDVNVGESSTFLIVRTNATTFATVQMSVSGSATSFPSTFAPVAPVAPVYTWDAGGGADTSWFTAANWSPDGVPGAGDTAILNTNATITLNAGDAIVANFTQNDGTFTGSKTLTVTGRFDFGKGTHGGTGSTVVNAGGTFAFNDIGATDAKTLDTRTLSILGTGTVTGTDDLTMNNGASLLVSGSFATGNLFDFLHTTGANALVRINPGASLIVNDATDVGPGVVFDGKGPISFPNTFGGLNVKGGGTFTGGAIALTSSLTHMRLDSDFAFGANTTFSGAGTLHTVSGTTTIPTGIILNGTGTAVYALDGGTLTGGGTITSAGRMDWNDGVLKNLTATFNGTPSFIAGSVSNTIDNATLNFGGGVVDTAAGVTLLNGATINISAGYEIRSGHDFAAGAGGGFLKVLPGGTLSNNVSSDVNVIGPGVLLTNNGTVSATSGNFDIQGGSNGTNARWNALLGNKILFNAGTHTLGGTTTFSEGAGGESQILTGATLNLNGPTNLTNAVVLRVNGGTLGTKGKITVTPNATLALTSGTVSGTGSVVVDGTFDWTAGVLTAAGGTSVSPGGNLLIGPGAKQLFRDFLNAGAGVVTGPLDIIGSGSFLNSGSLDFKTDTVWVRGGGPILVNSGTLLKSGGTGDSSFGGSLAISNTGTVEVRSGRFNFSAGFTQSVARPS